MAVSRVNKTRDFTVMSNHHFKDKRLSMKAKGLLSMMLSFSDDWDYSLNGLTAISKKGINAIRAMVHEIEDNGYLSHCLLRNDKWQVTVTEYTYMNNQPHLDNPTQAFLT